MTERELLLSILAVALALRCWCYRGEVKDLRRRCAMLAGSLHAGVERTRAMIDGAAGLKHYLDKGGSPDA